MIENINSYMYNVFVNLDFVRKDNNMGNISRKEKVEKSKKREKRQRRKEQKKNKKVIIISISVLILIGIIAGILLFLKTKSNNNASENNIATQSVKIFTESLNLFQNRYSGLVVAQNTVKIKKNSEQKIKDIYVEKGQSVTKGQKLFEYDTTESLNKIEQAKLEIEKMRTTITNSQKQIQTLAEQRNQNPADASITIEIQTLENDIKQTEYNIKTKNLEIDTLNKQIKKAVVTSEIDGVIQEVKDENSEFSNGMPEQEDADTFITIMQTGEYRIKGVVNEQNVMMFSAGQKVIIRSRIDESKTWSGSIENVDTSNPETDNNQRYMMDSSNPMTNSSKYPFYIKLDQKEGLMMGQHVYIEFDYGQEKTKEGIWIPSSFILDENGEKYIWVAGSKDKLEKRKIKIGEVDENILETQIVEGLSEDDYITEPKEGLQEGLKVDKYDNPEDIPFEDNFEQLNSEEVNFEEMTPVVEGQEISADIITPENGGAGQ